MIISYFIQIRPGRPPIRNLTLTVDHGITQKSLWTLALETSYVITADRIPSARRFAALVVVRTTLRAGISGETWWAVATITAIQICAESSRPAGVRI